MIREGTVRDVPILVLHRRGMWESLYGYRKHTLDESDSQYRKWITKQMRKGRIAAFLASSSDGRVAGSLVVWMREVEPGPDDHSGLAPFMSTMFVEPACRRRGFASALVRAAVKWCRKKGYPYVTGVPVNHAKRLLRKQGWQRLGEVGLVLSRRQPH
jgi:GNAT superfamily N-acetyltransferase